MRRRLQQILRTLPLGRRLGLVVAIFVTIVACLLALHHAEVEVLAGVRAYVSGEGFYSKGQKDAVQFLERYVATRNPRDWERYLDALAIPLGDHRARVEMERPDPDLDVVTAAFIAARNHSADIPEMFRFYRRFNRVSYMAKAIAIWKLGDRHIAKLARQGNVLHEEVSRGAGQTRRVRLALARVDALNDRLTPLEDNFSRTLAAGARWLARFLLRVTYVATAVLLTLGLGLSWMVLRHSREWEGKYRHLLETASDAIIVADGETGAILEANRRAEALLGLPGGRLVGMPQAAFHPTDESYRGFLAQVAAGQTASGELQVRRADGRIVPVEFSAAATEVDGRPVVQSILREISERQRADEVLRASRRRLEEEASISAALARVGRELISSLETPVLLERLCQVTTEVLGCEISETLLWDGAEDACATVASYGGDSMLAEPRRVPREMLSALFPRPGQENVAELRLLADDTRATGPQLVMLLRRGRDILGVQIACRGVGAPRFGPSELRVAEGIAYVASMAIANARLVGEIERASRLKSEFVSTMSHELRTPLHVILGYAEMARDPAFVGANRDACLTHIESAGRDLLALIEGTLEISRIDAGRDELRLEPVDIAALWSELGEGCARLPRRPDVALEWVADLPSMNLVTDSRKLTIVVRNLVGNALKFTEQGRVRAEARLDDGTLKLEVADTGIGIRPEDQDSIFEMFRQADGSDTRRYGGTGLGLYIVRRFVQQLGGSIVLDSIPGLGSTFTVALPAGQITPDVSARATSRAA